MTKHHSVTPNAVNLNMDVMVNKKKLINRLLIGSGACCDLCRGPITNKGVCDSCLADLPQIHHACWCCGLSLLEQGYCGGCITQKRPTDRIICAYYYHYPVDKLIKNIKYKQRLVSLDALAFQLINKIISLNATNIDLLVPVPMSKYRLMLRGMNQATQICKVISKQLNIPCDYTSLQRTKHTLPMHDLDTKARRRNVQNAFYWAGKKNPESIAIIDDIVTTGATCDEISLCLKANGIKRVETWALARAR